MARRHFGQVRARGARRSTSWFNIPPVSAALSGAAGTILVSLTTLELAKRPFTIVRTHLAYRITSDQSAASEIYGIGLGMCVVSDQASAIGVTAVPTPVSDAQSDFWFLHQFAFGDFLFATGNGFVEDQMTYRIDSKAMRKVSEDEDVLLVGENTGLGGGLNMQVAGRLMIKEH